MKALFLIFHGFEEANGISKKIRYQIKALKACGLEVDTCWLDDAHDHKRRMINNHVLRDYGNGIRGKILKRTELNSIVHYVKTNGIQLVYVRSDHNTTPFLICMLWRLKRAGVKVVMEIPTYPYDQEYKGLPWAYRRVLMADKCLRGLMATQIDKFVTFSDHKTIFGRPTIQISNGIDFDFIPLKQSTATTRELHLIAVATIHPWHGIDTLPPARASGRCQATHRRSGRTGSRRRIPRPGGGRGNRTKRYLPWPLVRRTSEPGIRPMSNRNRQPGAPSKRNHRPAVTEKSRVRCQRYPFHLFRNRCGLRIDALHPEDIGRRISGRHRTSGPVLPFGKRDPTG